MNNGIVRHLAFFFARAAPLKAAALLAFLAAMAVTVVFMVLQTFQQSGEQIAGTATGRFDFSLTYSEESPDSVAAHPSMELLADYHSLGVDALQLGYSSYQVSLTSNPDAWTNLYGRDWSTSPYPDRFQLLSGRLPQDPGEVTVSKQLAKQLDGDTLDLAGGAFKLHVVGEVLDNSNRAAPFGLVLPEVWESKITVSDQHPIKVVREFQWNGSADSMRTVPEQLSRSLERLGIQAESGEEIQQLVLSRAKLLQNQPRVYSEIVVITLLSSLLAGCIGGFLGAKFIRRIRQTLLQIGIVGGTTAGLFALSGAVILGALCGFGAGVAVGFLGARPIMDSFSSREIGPAYGLTQLGVTVVVLTFVGSALGAASLLLRQDKMAAAKPKALKQFSLAPVFAALSVLVFFTGLLCTNSPDLNIRFVSPFLFGTTLVLFTPLAVQTVARVRTDNLAVRLPLLRLRADANRKSLLVFGLAATLMLSFATLFVSHTGTENLNGALKPALPSHQAQFVPLVKSETAAVIFSEVQEYIADDSAVKTAMLSASSNINGAIIVLDSASDIEKLLGIKLSVEAVTALDSGTILLRNAVAEQQVQHVQQVQLDFGETRAAVNIPAVTIDAAPEYDAYGAGFVLAKTAAELNLPLDMPGWIFTNLSPQQVSLLKDTPPLFDYDKNWLLLSETPERRGEQPQLLIIAAAAGGLASLFIVFYTAGVARAARPTVAALKAVGLSRVWLNTLFVVEVGVATLTAIFFAVLGGLAAIYASTLTWVKADIYIPWGSTGLLLTVTLFAATAATLASARKITVAERPH